MNDIYTRGGFGREGRNIMGYDGIKCGAILDETIMLLKLASSLSTLDEFNRESHKILSSSRQTKNKYIEVIKERFLNFTDDGKIIHTPLLTLINLDHLEDSVKKEIIFYHLASVESVILQILYYLYNFLPQKKEISKTNFKSSVYLLMDKESSAMLKNLNDILEVFGFLSITDRKTIKFDYYPVSWQAFIYALYHHYQQNREKKKISLSMTDVFESVLPRIFLVNLQHMQRILSITEDLWLIRPAGKGFQNNFLLMSSLERVVQAF